MATICSARTGFEAEPLAAPFGFGGGSLTELWQTAVRLGTDGGDSALGVATQSVLWSDPGVFRECSEAAGNAAMYLLTEMAAGRCVGAELPDPRECLDWLLDCALSDASRTLGRVPRTTFALNALVALDNALWVLHARERGARNLRELLTDAERYALPAEHERLAWVPLLPYGATLAEVDELLAGGAQVLKIKIGSDPEGDGDPDAMLRWDIERVRSIHALACDRDARLTERGRVLYYLDVNGRYDCLERVRRLLDALDEMGALERVLVLEEPLPEGLSVDVSGLPVRVAADESAHTVDDARRRIEEGYGAVALKPIAKTLTMSLRIARLCAERGVPCFCADLTANPVLLEWNKAVASMLPPVPGMRVGLLEANGSQHYRDWRAMLARHPRGDALWVEPRAGAYVLDEGFHRVSGGIFEELPGYAGIAR